MFHLKQRQYFVRHVSDVGSRFSDVLHNGRREFMALTINLIIFRLVSHLWSASSAIIVRIKCIT